MSSLKLKSNQANRGARPAFMAYFGTVGEEQEKATKEVAYFGTVGEEQEKATKEAEELLKILEEQALGEKFFGGNEIGLTDLAFGWIAGWLGVIEAAVGVRVLEADKFPRLHAWTKTFKENSVIKHHLPDPDKMLAYYKSKLEMFFKSSSCSTS